MKNSLLLLLCFALVLSCKKDNNSNPGSSGGTTTTSGSCGSGSFEANGVLMTHNGVLAPSSPLCSTVSGVMLPDPYTGEGAEVNLIVNVNMAYWPLGDPFTIVLALNPGETIQTGITYTAQQHDLSLVFIDYILPPGNPPETDIYYSGYVTQSNIEENGEITFTKFDRIDSLISGTFSVTLYKASQQADSLVITNGTFQDLPCFVL